MPPSPCLFDPPVAQAAADDLARRDPRLAKLAAAVGPVRLRPKAPGGAFGFLVRSILHQQVATAAARAITARALQGCGENGRFTAQGLRRAGERGLRACGVSGPKIRALLALADAERGGTLRLAGLGRLDDDAIVERLVEVPGIGPWTVQMLLIFHLGRPDVFPDGDLAVRAGVGEIWCGGAPPKPRDAKTFAEAWAPHRSTVAWWMWRWRSGRIPGIT